MTKFVPMIGLLAALLLPPQFAASALAQEKVRVVTSFSILADLARMVGAERVTVKSFVGPNTDMHVFQPAPADAKLLLEADLVIVNGLGFEGWADRLVKASGYKGPLVIASNGIKPLAAEPDGHGHGHGKGQAHAERNDPHAWQDVANVKTYVANIRDALAAADATGKDDYARRADDALKALDMLDAEIKATFAPLAKTQRRVITSHEAFAYYGRAYDIAFLAPQGVGGDQEPTAKGVASLVRQIKRERIRAVFVENISNPRMIERIAKETGVTIGGALYSDALSAADGPAATYLAMMRHNTQLLAASMK